MTTPEGRRIVKAGRTTRVGAYRFTVYDVLDDGGEVVLRILKTGGRYAPWIAVIPGRETFEARLFESQALGLVRDWAKTAVRLDDGSWVDTAGRRRIVLRNVKGGTWETTSADPVDALVARARAGGANVDARVVPGVGVVLFADL